MIALALLGCAVVVVDTAWGELIALTEAPSGAAEVTLRRSLAGMFDGLDPAPLPESVLGQEMVINLVEGLTLSWSERPGIAQELREQ